MTVPAVPALPIPAPSPATFWQSDRPEIQALQWEARRRKASRWGVLAAALTDSLLSIPYTVRYSSTFREEGSPLNIALALVGGSGTGKGGAFKAARRAVRYDGIDFPAPSAPRSGQALAALLASLEQRKRGDSDDDEPPRLRWARDDHAAHVHFDEVGEFAARGAGEGSTLFASVTAGASGEQLGGQNARGDGLTIPGDSYRLAVTIGAQPKMTAPLLTEGRVASGLAGRFLWFRVEDPDAAGLQRPTTPTEPVSVTLGHWEGVRFVAALDEMEAVHDADIDAAHRGERDPIHSRLVLNRAFIAIALANMNGRAKLISEDWALAGYVTAHSQEVLDSIRDDLAAPEEDHVAALEGRTRDRLDTMRRELLPFHEARRRLSNPQRRALDAMLTEGRFSRW